MPLQLEEEKKKEKEEEGTVVWREGRKRTKTEEERSDDVVGQVWTPERKKNGINLVYLGLDYFGAIFGFLLRSWFEIGGYKMEGLHLLLTKVKLIF
jgi:hypothetical protein